MYAVELDAQPMGTDANNYPDFSFALYLPPEFETDSAIKRPEVVAQALSALTICAAIMSEHNAHDVIPMSAHSYSNNKLRWHSNYMSAPLPPEFNSQATNAVRRRRSIVDQDKVVAEVLDELSINNHPVFQLVSWLQNHYGEHIGQTDTADVAHDIVLMTQLPHYQAAVDRQVEARRASLIPDEPRQPGSLKGRVRADNPGTKMPKTDSNGEAKRDYAPPPKHGSPKSTGSKKAVSRSRNSRNIKVLARGTKPATPTAKQPKRPIRLVPKRKPQF